MCSAGKTLLNLDTEDWGEIFIGCAGGGDSMITLPVQHEALSSSNADAYTITVSGTVVQTAHLQCVLWDGVSQTLLLTNQSHTGSIAYIRVLGGWHIALLNEALWLSR